MKVHSNFKVFAGVHFDASKYISSPSFGVDRFMLDRVGGERARATTIVKYQPNSTFPSHTHVGGEEFFVLEGTFKDQFGEFTKGTYVRNPIDSQHAPWVDHDGCTIFVKLLQMADTKDLSGPLFVNVMDETKATCTTENGRVMELYYNEETGERVQMYWLEPNQVLQPVSGGEEILVVEGELKAGDETYKKWGWMRFPDSSLETRPRAQVQSGFNGAQIFRKTGHLTEKALSMEHIQITSDD
jgi:hypothetical protein